MDSSAESCWVTGAASPAATGLYHKDQLLQAIGENSGAAAAADLGDEPPASAEDRPEPVDARERQLLAQGLEVLDRWAPARHHQAESLDGVIIRRRRSRWSRWFRAALVADQIEQSLEAAADRLMVHRRGDLLVVRAGFE